MRFRTIVKRVRQLRRRADKTAPKFESVHGVVALFTGDPEKDFPGPTKEQEKLTAFLSSLPREVIYKLVACMWAGRRNFKQVREAFLIVRKRGQPSEHLISYMVGKGGLLARYLERGLEMAAQEFEDLDGDFAVKPGKRVRSAKRPKKRQATMSVEDHVS